MRMSRSEPLLSGDAPVGGEAEVVVLAVEHSAGERVVLFHRRGAAGGGLGEADLRGRAVALDLLAQRLRVDGVGAGSEGVGDQLLHRHERVSDLVGPAPLLLACREVGDADPDTQLWAIAMADTLLAAHHAATEARPRRRGRTGAWAPHRRRTPGGPRPRTPESRAESEGCSP